MAHIWMHRTNSFLKAKQFEWKIMLSSSPEERLNDIQLCREQYFKIRGLLHESRKRLRRVVRIIKQA